MLLVDEKRNDHDNHQLAHQPSRKTAREKPSSANAAVAVAVASPKPTAVLDKVEYRARWNETAVFSCSRSIRLSITTTHRGLVGVNQVVQVSEALIKRYTHRIVESRPSGIANSCDEVRHHQLLVYD